MSVETTCPVCHFEHIPSDSDCCPQCDSDLVCFRLLDALPDFPGDSLINLPKDTQSAVEEESWSDTDKIYKSKVPGFSIFLIVLILLTIVCLGGYTVHRFSSIQAIVQKMDTGMAQINAKLNKNSKEMNQILTAEIKQVEDMEKCVTELVEVTKNIKTRLVRIMPEKETVSKTFKTINKIREPCFDTYCATDKDSLWTIARDLYGSGIFYPVLMEHNPDVSVYSISSKDTLRYLCDKTKAVDVYNAITGMKQKKRYWKYTIRSGDTRKSIINRYCLNKKDCLIEDKPLEPGMTIGVFLE